MEPVGIRVQPLLAADPRQLGPHVVLGRLGAGGMGVVYLGEGPQGRVALKVIRSELAESGEFRVRFLRELRAIFRVSGPWTAKLVDFDVASDPPWLATEFIDGVNLEDLVEQAGPLDAAGQVIVGRGIAEALLSLHSVGIIHRDLKPSNVLCPPQGMRVIDFGIAAATDAATVSSAVLGTPAWMAPERLEGIESGPASDVYSWGAVLSYAASGLPLFTGETPAQLLFQVARGTPRVRSELIAPGLRELVLAALARDPRRRPGTSDLLDVLRKLPPAHGPGVDTAPQPTRPVRFVPAVLPPPPPPPPPTLRRQPARRFPRRGLVLTALLVAVVLAAAAVPVALLRAAGSGKPRPLPTPTGQGGGLISTVAGGGASLSVVPEGRASDVQLIGLQAIAVRPDGTLFFIDGDLVGRVSASGEVSLVAGEPTAPPSFSGDGGPATKAALDIPMGLAVDSAGNIYLADTGNQRIRRISPSGVITTVAGNGQRGFSGDNGSATSASLANPAGVAVDNHGNLYIGDTLNNRVRRVSPAGIITTIAGNGQIGSGGDGGPPTAAQIEQPTSVAVDGTGDVFTVGPVPGVIRKIDISTDTISTIAGSDKSGFSGDGGAATLAQLNLPSALVVDGAGNLFVADSDNNRIRRITPNGVITTVAGDGTAGFAGDGGAATAAELQEPNGVAVDGAGNLYICDERNFRIRRVQHPVA